MQWACGHCGMEREQPCALDSERLTKSQQREQRGSGIRTNPSPMGQTGGAQSEPSHLWSGSFTRGRIRIHSERKPGLLSKRCWDGRFPHAQSVPGPPPPGAEADTNSESVKGLNARTETVTSLGRNTAVTLRDLGFGRGLLGMTPKVPAARGEQVHQTSSVPVGRGCRDPGTRSAPSDARQGADLPGSVSHLDDRGGSRGPSSVWVGLPAGSTLLCARRGA